MGVVTMKFSLGLVLLVVFVRPACSRNIDKRKVEKLQKHKSRELVSSELQRTLHRIDKNLRRKIDSSEVLEEREKISNFKLDRGKRSPKGEKSKEKGNKSKEKKRKKDKHKKKPKRK